MEPGAKLAIAMLIAYAPFFWQVIVEARKDLKEAAAERKRRHS